MSNDIATMKCDWCGKEFPADARACVEAGIDVSHAPEEGEEWKSEGPPSLNPAEFSEDQRGRLKTELEIDDKQLDELLSTGKIEGLGAVICLECQDTDETP